MTNMLLSVMAVVIFAYCLWKIFDLNSGATPLISLCSLLTVVIFCAMLGQLKIGVYLSYLISATAFVFAVKKDNGKIAKDFFSTPVILFFAFVIFIMVVLITQKPMLSQWDEFSFWGTAAKLVKERGALYTYYKSSMIGSSMPPALPLLCFYFGYGFTEFQEWARFFAYDLLIISSFCAIISVIDKKNERLSMPCFRILFLLPYFFAQPERLTGIAPMYITLYSEMPLAFLFIGCVAVYLSCKYDNEKRILPVLPVIAVLTFAKDMGLALSCIALFIIFWDMVFSKKDFEFFRIKGLSAKIISAFTMLFTTGFSYFAWAFHMSRVMQRDPTALGGESNMGAVGLVMSGIKELLGLQARSEKFTAVTGLMLRAFFNIKISMLGSGAVVCCVILLLFCVAFIASDRQGKIQTIVMYISSLVGFVGYYIFHLFLYVYIFKDNAYSLTSYNRYIYPYYLAWLILGIISIFLAINRGSGKIREFAVMLFGAVVIFSFYRYLLPQNTFMDINQNVYTKRIAVAEQADFLKDTIGENDVIYLLSEEDSGQSWFMYTYELTDNIVLQEPNIVLDENLSEEEQAEEYCRELAKFLKEKNVTHFMVDYPSPRSHKLLNRLFDVDMGQFGLGTVGYYKINYTDDGFYCQLLKATGIN